MCIHYLWFVVQFLDNTFSVKYEKTYGDKPLSVLTATACTVESDSGVRRARYTIPNSPAK